MTITLSRSVTLPHRRHHLHLPPLQTPPPSPPPQRQRRRQRRRRQRMRRPLFRVRARARVRARVRSRVRVGVRVRVRVSVRVRVRVRVRGRLLVRLLSMQPLCHERQAHHLGHGAHVEAAVQHELLLGHRVSVDPQTLHPLATCCDGRRPCGRIARLLTQVRPVAAKLRVDQVHLGFEPAHPKRARADAARERSQADAAHKSLPNIAN